MGYYDDREISFIQRRYRDSDKYICAAHFNDDYINSKIKNSHNRGKCSFCGKIRNVIPFNDILSIVVSFLNKEYLLAEDDAIYDSEENNYIDPVIDSYDFVHDELKAFLDIEDDKILDEFENNLILDTYINRDIIESRQEEKDMQLWNEFCDIVKRISLSAEQIVSLSNKHNLTEDIRKIHITLNMVWSHCKDLYLVKTQFGKSSQYSPQNYYRCINYLPEYNKKNSSFFSDLPFIPATLVGTAPAKNVQNNRMSEAGDMMFYGAEDINTAINEVGKNEKYPSYPLTVGTFHSNKRFLILDLSCLGEWQCPSIFDIGNANKRSSWFFLRKFMECISQPKETTDSDDFYKPTQVFTKYIQRKTSLQGIKFRSSKTKQGCYVLFVVNRDCLDSEDKMVADRNQLIMDKVEQLYL